MQKEILFQPAYPTSLHRQAAEFIATYFSSRPQIDAVLLVNSCARGQATPQSDLDMAVLISPERLAAEEHELITEWQEVAHSHRPLTVSTKPSRNFYRRFSLPTAPTRWSTTNGSGSR
jgi:predicted nucleotidyltransferase